jgi:predicted TIM-barrel fold metal-dependent hydrolase
VLSGAAAASAATALTSVFAQLAASGKPHRIDVHHHFSPPEWIASVRGRELLQRANSEWTPARSIEDMDNAGVAAAVVSVTNPGLWFGDQEATRRIARECNEYGAKLVQDNPGRFGLFAAMPLPDIDATLREIEYAYDTLKADGIHLFTSYGDTWLGNAVFTPVMAELNRRKAVVHVHPTAANCCKNLIPGMAPGVMEYGTDTTRAILVSCSAALHPLSDIQYIWSHAGGTARSWPGALSAAFQLLKEREQRLPNGAMHELKRFHYDVAGAANPGALASLLKLVTTARVLFGTDFPPAGPSLDVVRSLAQIGFSEADLRAIDRENAIKLLPRLARSEGKRPLAADEPPTSAGPAQRHRGP